MPGPSVGHPEIIQQEPEAYYPRENPNLLADDEEDDMEQTEEEPICVLKVELDGEHTEQLRIYASKDPRETVETFGEQFNLSETAKRRLLSNIYAQIRQKEVWICRKILN